MKRADGIRTQDDLQLRCVVDPDTLCWHWRGATDSNGRPSFRFPPLGGAIVSAGVAAAYWRTGERPKRGTAWHTICRAGDCVNPQHRRCGTRKSQMLALRLKKSPLSKARISAGRLKKSRITESDIAEIRAKSLTVQEIVDRWGISRGYASNIRTGRARHTKVAPQSSVFTMGAALHSVVRA
jgi:hypothetical protein